jgi:O-antigen/teichoic acid export membrane protein
MSETVNSSLRTAVKGTTLILLGTVVSMFLWLATKILIVRNTTSDEFGIYSLALAVVGIISAVATLGLREGVARFVSIFLGEDKKHEAQSISRDALRISLASSISVFLLLLFLSPLISRYVFYMPEFEPPLRVFSFVIPLTIMSHIVGAILRGHNIIRPRVYYLDVGHPLFFLVFLCAVLLLGLPFMGILYSYVLAMAVVFLSISSYGYRKIRLKPLSLRGGRHGRELLGFSLPLLTVSVMGMVLTWTDTLMLGRYTGAQDVGVYNISVTLARLATFPLGALVFVFMPLAGEMYASSQIPELKRTYQVLTKWIFSATIPIFFVLFFFPEMTITFLFSDRFIEASMPLRILSLGFLFHTFLGANGMLMMVFGLSRSLMHLSVFGALLGIALNYILIKRLGMGITGAAVATAVAYIAINITTSYILYRESRIHPFTARYLRPVAGSSVVALLIYALAKSLPLYLWLMPLYFILFIGGYIFSLLLTRSLDSEDIALFEAVSKKTGLEMRLMRKTLHKFMTK